MGSQHRVDHADSWLYSPKRLKQHIDSLDPKLLVDEEKGRQARYNLNEMRGIPNVVEPN